MNLLTQNSKLKKTSKHFNKRVFNFGIPAYKSKSGKITCPFADECIKFCYARKCAYIWSNVSPAFEKRYELSKTIEFVELMNDEIRRKRADYVRVHDSGDYYSKEYLNKWFLIAELNPRVRFYSYTNNVKMIKELINKNTDRHTRIFKSVKDLKRAKYVDSSNYDLYATKWYSKSNNIGLVIH